LPIRNHLPRFYAASRFQHLDRFRAFATVSVGYFLTAHSIASRCSGRHGQQPLLGLLAAFVLERNQLAQELHRLDVSSAFRQYSVPPQ
jgi:hypothetical protein